VLARHDDATELESRGIWRGSAGVAAVHHPTGLVCQQRRCRSTGTGRAHDVDTLTGRDGPSCARRCQSP
jgi:hypothetical protein